MPIGQVPPPTQHPDEQPLACIKVNYQWVPIILGALTPLKYPEYWAGSLIENRTARKDFGILIDQLMKTEECGEMSGCCPDLYVTQKVDPDTGNIVTSYDNGNSYVPTPNGIPSKVVEPVPPVTSGVASDKCDAAENVHGQILDWITHVTNDFDTATDLFAFGVAVISAIADAALLILSEGALTALETAIIGAISAAVAAVYAGGKTIFSNYWTDDVKHQILCIVYNHIGDDGSFSDAQFSAMWNDFNLHLPGAIAKGLFMGFCSSMSRQGFNAMAASGKSTGADCTSCTSDGTCWEFDFTTDEFPITLPDAGYGVWVSGQGWQIPYFSGFDQLDAVFAIDWSTAYHITAVEYDTFTEVAGCRTPIFPGGLPVGEATSHQDKDGSSVTGLATQEWVNDSHDITPETLWYWRRLRIYTEGEAMTFEHGHAC